MEALKELVGDYTLRMSTKPNNQSIKEQPIPPNDLLAKFFDVLIEMDFELKRKVKKEKNSENY